jgi:3-hydroxyacyl-[acyl-carrier-protein] dehydratase
MASDPLFPFDSFSVERPLYTIEQIREVNPQRFEMEQLTAVLLVDTEQHGLVGYKDLTQNEFWVRGHMPEFALMPGVILCECAAQLAGFYGRKYKILGGGDFLGFGGLEDVRFRAPVFPGDQLVVMAKLVRLRQGKRAEFEFQGFVNQKLVFSGLMIGVPIVIDQARAGLEASQK